MRPERGAGRRARARPALRLVSRAAAARRRRRALLRRALRRDPDLPRRQGRATRARTGAFEHHLIVPGPRERHGPAVTSCRRCGSRPPTATACRSARGPLVDARCASSRPTSCCCTTRSGRRAASRVARRARRARWSLVHHGSLELDAAALPGPDAALPARAARAGCAAPTRASTPSCPPSTRAPTAAAPATLPLRFGLDPAFYPRRRRAARRPRPLRRPAGREKGVFELLEAAARVREPWPLRLMGAGARPRRRRRARRAARASASASAAARTSATATRSPRAYARRALRRHAGRARDLRARRLRGRGERRARSSRARPRPSARALGELAHTFAPGRRRRPAAPRSSAPAPREPDRLAAARFAAANRWERAFAAELADLEALVGDRARDGAALARSPLARRRAGDVRALRADPRLARRPRRRPRDAARDPRAAAAPVPGALAGAGRTGCSTASTPATRSPSTGSSTGARAGPRRSRAPLRAAGRAARAAEFPGLDARGHDAPVEAGRACSRRAGLAAARLRRARLRLHGRAARSTLRRALRLVGDAARAARRPRATHDARALPRARAARSSARASPALMRAGAALLGQRAAARPPPGRLRPPAPRRWRSSASSARARPHRGHLRRALLLTHRRRRGASCARTGARACAATARRSRSPAPSPPRYQHQWYWDSCFHAIAWSALRPAAGARRSCGRCCGPAGPTASSRTRCSGRRPPRWRRAPLYATARLPR